ncbi:hypothetical protein PARMER_03180 [Parabacteroides merdae ATCC 43184]|nr:hypothetical protein PARMER_03180 [Parabacteroides merdae ATCC 43184]
MVFSTREGDKIPLILFVQNKYIKSKSRILVIIIQMEYSIEGNFSQKLPPSDN